jgi:hypothetical protein
MYVFVISSGQSLSSINNAIKVLSKEDFHTCIFYRRNHQIEQTKKTLLFTEEKGLDEKIKEKGYEIMPYNWESFVYPSKEGHEVNQLHFSQLPTTMTEGEAREILEEGIAFLTKKYPQYEGKIKFDITLRDRAKELVKGFGSITFADDVPDEFRHLVKLMLHNMRLPSSDDNPFHLTCHWQVKISKDEYQKRASDGYRKPRYGGVRRPLFGRDAPISILRSMPLARRLAPGS